MRFLRLSDSSEVVYDSCLPDYFDIINIEPVESEYKYRGETALKYEGDPELIYETGTTFLSAVKQFPFEGNPKRRIQKTAAIVSVAGLAGNDVMSDPVDFTGVSLDPLDTAFLTRYAFVSRAPGLTKPNYTESFIPATDPDGAVYDLSTNLSSSYFFTASDGGILYDVSTNSHDLDLTPDPDGAGGTTSPHPTPIEISDVPVSGLLNDGSLVFPSAAYGPSSVTFVAATTQIDDHMMTYGSSVDVAFTLSITFKSSASTEQVLIERSVPGNGAVFATEYRVWIDSIGLVNFRIYENGISTYKGKYSLTPVGTGWNNVTVTYDGDETKTTGSGMRIYLNGREYSSIDDSSGHTGTQMYKSTTSRLLIAAGKKVNSWEPDETKEFVGYIHALHIWKGRALTASEVAALSRAERSCLSNGIIKHRADFGLTSYDGPLRRGTYRYGISSIAQESTTFTFNPTHFGYARDALEQRKETAFVGVKPPVVCRFISGSQLVDPSLTHAQNISSFATSSLPYFDDGVARNRADNPDDDLVI